MITPRFHEPRCKICQSPNRDYYEKIHREGKGNVSYKDLQRLAKDKFNESISFMSFQRHMSKHMIFDQLRVTSGTKLDKEVEGTLNILDSLKQSLKELQDTINLGVKVFSAKPSPMALNAITNALDKKRALLSSIEQLGRNLSQRREGLTEQELLQELVWGTELLCKKCAPKLVKRIMERLHKNG